MLKFITEFDAQTGQLVPEAPGVARVTAPNASPFTFTGTNSFLLGSESVAVFDPGPDERKHLDALLRAIGGRTVEAIILSHTHVDHAGLTPALQAATGAPIWVIRRDDPRRLKERAWRRDRAAAGAGAMASGSRSPGSRST